MSKHHDADQRTECSSSDLSVENSAKVDDRRSRRWSRTAAGAFLDGADRPSCRPARRGRRWIFGSNIAPIRLAHSFWLPPSARPAHAPAHALAVTATMGRPTTRRSHDDRSHLGDLTSLALRPLSAALVAASPVAAQPASDPHDHSSPAPRPSGGMMGMMGMMGMGGHTEGRIAFLKAELKITDAQTPQWNAFRTPCAPMPGRMMDDAKGNDAGRDDAGWNDGSRRCRLRARLHPVPNRMGKMIDRYARRREGDGTRAARRFTPRSPTSRRRWRTSCITGQWA